MNIPKPKMGRPSKYEAMLNDLIQGKRPFIKFKNRSNADTCATYYRNHFRSGECAVRKHTDKDFRVYVEVNS